MRLALRVDRHASTLYNQLHLGRNMVPQQLCDRDLILEEEEEEEGNS
jgi:hypothetical protein